MQNKTTIAAISSLLLLNACSSTPTLTDGARTIHLNSNIGVNIKEYQYSQSQISCDIDTKLIEHISDRAATKNIRIITADTYMEMEKANYLLAIDITDLPNSSERNFVGSKSVSPELGIQAVLINKKNPKSSNQVFDEHCTGLISTGGSVDFGADGGHANRGGSTQNNVCKALRSCSKKLSNKLARWLATDVNY